MNKKIILQYVTVHNLLIKDSIFLIKDVFVYKKHMISRNKCWSMFSVYHYTQVGIKLILRLFVFSWKKIRRCLNSYQKLVLLIRFLYDYDLSFFLKHNFFADRNLTDPAEWFERHHKIRPAESLDTISRYAETLWI